MLSPEAIEEFKMLYRQEFGKELTNEQAIYLGTKLVRFVKVVYGDVIPIIKIKMDPLTKNDKKL